MRLPAVRPQHIRAEDAREDNVALWRAYRRSGHRAALLSRLRRAACRSMRRNFRMRGTGSGGIAGSNCAAKRPMMGKASTCWLELKSRDEGRHDGSESHWEQN
mgnify:CR=1 FL=1